MQEIKIKYHTEDMPKLERIGGAEKSAWIDLYTAEDYEIEVGKFYMLSLGVSMELPEGYEALVVPRSSTFKKYNILQTNSVGLIDYDYRGSNDIWRFPLFIPAFQEDMRGLFIDFLNGMFKEQQTGNFGKYSTAEEFTDKYLKFRTVKIPKNTRLCQFRIEKSMDEIKFVESDLNSESRGGFGEGTGH